MMEGTIAGKIIVGFTALLGRRLLAWKASLTLLSNDYFCFIGQS